MSKVYGFAMFEVTRFCDFLIVKCFCCGLKNKPCCLLNDVALPRFSMTPGKGVRKILMSELVSFLTFVHNHILR